MDDRDLLDELAILPRPDVGGVLVVRTDFMDDDERVREMVDDVRRYYQRLSVPVPLMVFLRRDDSIEVLDEAQMAAAGWVRRKQNAAR